MNQHAKNFERINAMKPSWQPKPQQLNETPEERAQHLGRFNLAYHSVTHIMGSAKPFNELGKRVIAFQLDHYTKHPHRKIFTDDFIAAGLIPKRCPHRLCDGSGTITYGEGDNIITKACICEVERKRELEANQKAD
ncbi:MAG: hypothetical protein KGL39_32825 [Patescibacteria group bacterium]|nr:hypothetical protein [Patescibacteria group bacterium]